MPHLRDNQPGAVNTGHHGVGRRTGVPNTGMVLPEREVTSHPSMGTLISFGSMPNGMMEFQSYNSHSSLLSLADSVGGSSRSPTHAKRASLPWEGFPIDAANAKFGRVSQQEMQRRLTAALDQAQSVRAEGTGVALAVDTATLDSIMTYRLTDRFVQLSKLCSAVVCARV